jgi:ribosome biogenesis GTPase A
MTKTKRQIEADLSLCDTVAEIVDSRVPLASRSDVLDKITGNKPRILVLNKCDTADNSLTKEWAAFYKERGLFPLICDCRSGFGVNGFVPLLKVLLADLLERRRLKGTSGKTLRVMVVGVPNSGKSSFVNRLAGGRKTEVGDRPGVTRGKQWLRVTKEVELLDTPGVLTPKFEDNAVAMRLAFTGAIKDNILDTTDVSLQLAKYLFQNYPNGITERYGVNEYSLRFLEELALSRKFLCSGGVADTERAAAVFLDEFRAGKLGRVTLEKP